MIRRLFFQDEIFGKNFLPAKPRVYKTKTKNAQEAHEAIRPSSAARAPAQIKLGAVVRFIDGPVEPVACAGKHYKGCADINRCVFKEVWDKVSEETCKIIDNITFEDLVKKNRNLNKSLTYQI